MGFAPGENVGPYRIVDQLGSGGMATVYKAYHAALDRFVAMKVMHPAFKGDINFLTRFQREARVVAKLEHPNIVPVYDFSEHEGSPYLVMRFVEGETLKACLTRNKLTLPEILDIIRPVGDALTYAHEQGVLHRDMKPSNVLLTADRSVFLTDFGLARIMQAGESSLTRDAMVGTPFYISPEQAIGKSELDARTDIYSFGVVLYELFTGRVPFQSDTPFAVIHDHIYTPLPLPSSINPNLPPALEQVLLKALAKKPEDRFATALELVAAVEAAVTGEAAIPTARPSKARMTTSTTAETAAQVRRSERPLAKQATTAPATTAVAPTAQRKGARPVWLAALAGAVLLAVVAFAAIFLLADGDDQQPTPTPTTTETSVQQPLPADQLPADEIPPDQERPLDVGRALDMANQGDVDGALAIFEEAIRRNPELSPAYIELARTLFLRGAPEPAIMILERAVRANPEDVDLHLNFAQALVAVDRWEEALREIDWLIERAPELAEPLAFLSIHLAINEGDLGGAEHHAAEALRLDPESPEAHFAMGVFLWKSGDLRNARRELEQARRSARVSPILRQRILSFLERLD